MIKNNRQIIYFYNTLLMKLPITLSFGHFFSLTNTMFKSNPLIIISTKSWIFTSDDVLWKWEYENRKTQPDVTITHIDVRSIQFSIGDTVMILSTGEIGEIDEIIEWFSYIVKSDTLIDYYTGYELVKIPTRLINKLQD